MNKEEKTTIWVLVIILVGVGLIRLGWAKLVYNDPKCAITHCVRNKP